MSFTVNFSNRQRKQKLDSKKWTETSNEIAAAIIRNLEERKPSHLSKKKIKQIAERGSLNLVFASNETVRKLNREWRDKDTATDVLSFPQWDEEPPLPLPWEIGDVIVSVEKALEQSKDYGHSLERELSFLFVHGFLHVLGFDHVTAAEEREMFSRQKEILDALGIKRKR